MTPVSWISLWPAINSYITYPKLHKLSQPTSEPLRPFGGKLIVFHVETLKVPQIAGDKVYLLVSKQFVGDIQLAYHRQDDVHRLEFCQLSQQVGKPLRGHRCFLQTEEPNLRQFRELNSPLVINTAIL